jgi:hypothetical protein
LPDGIFSDQKSKLGYIWRALKKKMLVCFVTVLNILRPFGIFYWHLVTLWSFGIFFTRCTKKNLATLTWKTTVAFMAYR